MRLERFRLEPQSHFNNNLLINYIYIDRKVRVIGKIKRAAMKVSTRWIGHMDPAE